MDGTININIKNENGKDIICNADDVEKYLSLNEKKWALFKIKNKNEIKYLYCSDIESTFNENVGDYGMFKKIENIEEVNVVVCDSINVKRTSAMFALCNNLVSLNLKKLNTQNVNDMRNMFGFCNKLKNVFLFENVTNVVNMAYLFNNCYLLETINGLKEWNTKNVCVVSNMFNGCRNLKKFIFKKIFEDQKQDLLNKFQIKNPGVCCFIE